MSVYLYRLSVWFAPDESSCTGVVVNPHGVPFQGAGTGTGKDVCFDFVQDTVAAELGFEVVVVAYDCDLNLCWLFVPLRRLCFHVWNKSMQG